MTHFTAKRTNPNVPAWDLFEVSPNPSAPLYLVGYMTHFPGEGPVATVRLVRGDEGVTVKAPTLHKTLWLARAAYEDLKYDREQNEEFIEDEDGELARMRYEENKSDEWASREYDGSY
jgi:hypothetical protein|tara:strand:- start:89 stop:442 length:354 start_codon:yes stop_codon:yes gene_type:complete